jgi:hypothetical protein
MLLVSSILAQSKPAPMHQWAPGKYVVVVKVAASQDMKTRGSTTMQSDDRYELLVQTPDPKGQSVQVVFKRFSVQGKGGTIEGLQHDTDRPDEPEQSEIQSLFKAIIGTPLATTIGTDGKIGEISGADEVVKKSDAHNNAIDQRTIVDMCKISAKSFLTPLKFQFPQEPIVKGYSWSRNDSTDLGMMGAIKMVHTYKVKAVEDTPNGKVADIEYTAKNTSNKLDATDEDSKKWAQLMQIDEMTQQVDGAIKLNLNTGMVIFTKLHTKTTTKGTASMDGGSAPVDSMTENDTEITVTPVRSTPTSSTRPS